MRLVALPILLLILLLSFPALAHDLQYTVAESNVVVVKLFYPDNTKFSYENYEIFRPDEEIPFQVGRTDAHGRIVFAPDQAGTWNIKAFSEDGHGMEISVEVDENNVLSDTDKPLGNRLSRLMVGVAVIFGLFGFLSIFYRRRKS